MCVFVMEGGEKKTSKRLCERERRRKASKGGRQGCREGWRKQVVDRVNE